MTTRHTVLLSLMLGSLVSHPGCTTDLAEHFEDQRLEWNSRGEDDDDRGDGGAADDTDDETPSGLPDAGASDDGGARAPTAEEQCAEEGFLSGETCMPWRVCTPGTFVATEGTIEADSQCNGCPSGTFAAMENASACGPWTECQAGEFVAQQGNASQDQVCGTCPEDQTSTGTNAGACHPLDGCPGGTFEVTQATEDSDAECDDCDAGTFCAGGSTPPTECSEGNWDHDEDPRTRCAKMTTCGPGEFVLVEGDPVTDRQCAHCASGTFTLETNTAECQQWSECAAGSFVESNGDETSDRGCAGCAPGTFTDRANRTSCSAWTTCDPGEVVVTDGSATSDQECLTCAEDESSASASATQCTPNGECPAGTEQTAPGTATSEPDCADCSPGGYCAGSDTPAQQCAIDSWDHDADPATPCVPHTQCLAGSYVSVPGTSLRNATCVSCAAGTFSTAGNAPMCQPWQTCAAGTYRQTSGGPTTDVECDGCPSGTYSSTSNAVDCTTWTDCQPGEYVDASGDATTDRDCSSCPVGEYSSALNAGSCVPLGQCPAGSVETVPGSEIAPPQCAPCTAGNFCAGAQAPAVACGSNDWDEDGNPATPCVAKRVCAAGQFVADNGSPTTNRTCSPCASGKYSSTMNATSCATWASCGPGEFVGTQGTSTANRVCSDCPSGQYSTTSNVLACTAWATCAAPSFYESQTPSATVNRGCGTCTSPEITSYDNDPTCSIPAFQMSGGQVVMEAENYHSKATNGSMHSWNPCAHAGISGGCMEIGGDFGYTWTSGIQGNSPRLDYNVNFTSTGTFYFWIRGDNGNGSLGTGDTCWAGMDNTLLSSMHDFPDNSDAWSWTAQTVNVSTTGIHTVSVWGREDGFQFDKIVVKTSATAPTGNGPSESVQ